jgi:CRP/FNR family transcriptional regulator
MQTDRIEALRKTALFRSLEDRELSAIASHAIEQKLSRGEILFLAGDLPRGLFVIVDGAVRAFRVGTDGREQVIHVERSGATVGELPVFDEGPYPSTVAAEEESVLLFVPKADVQRLLIEHPRIALAALKVLAGRLRNCASLVETLSLHDVDRRLARLLLVEARARGHRSGSELELDFGLTHQQIASRIGSVREVVSRAYSRLQQSGLIKINGKKITIPSEPALAEYVEQE